MEFSRRTRVSKIPRRPVAPIRPSAECPAGAAYRPKAAGKCPYIVPLASEDFSRTFAAVDGAGIKRKWAPVIFDACWHELRPNVCRFVRYCDQNVTRDKQAGRNLRTYAHHIVQMVPVFRKKNRCFISLLGSFRCDRIRSGFRLVLRENSIRTIDA